MPKTIGNKNWFDCHILIDKAMGHFVCAAISNMCHAEEKIDTLLKEMVCGYCGDNALDYALSYLGFDVKTEIIDGMSYFTLRPAKAGLDSNRESLEQIVFPTIAPFVLAGSKITYELEDGEFIRYLFDGTKCTVEKGRITFPSDPQYVVLKGIFDGYPRGPAAIVVGSYADYGEAARAFNDEVLVEIAELRAGQYPDNIDHYEDLDHLLWVAAEKKNGMQWPIVQISVQTTNGDTKEAPVDA